MKIRPAQLTALLTKLIPARRSVLIKGKPGIGKTDLIDQVCVAVNARLLIWHPVVDDPTDYKGMPWPDAKAKRATFLPFGNLAELIEATELTVCFFDDIGQANPSVQAALMQVILTRRINGHKISDNVVFIGATNSRTDGAGVQGILTPLISRFSTVLELEPTIDDWTAWAIGAGIPPELIAFLRFRPALLLQFDPKLARDIESFPCPRTWQRVAEHMTLGLPLDLMHIAIAGAVGETPAGELIAFLKMYRDAPNPDAIMLDPSSAPVPTEPSALCAVSTALAGKATASNIDRIITYCQRMHTAKRGDFAALTLRDAYRRKPEIASTAAFVQLQSTELGKLIQGTL